MNLTPRLRSTSRLVAGSPSYSLFVARTATSTPERCSSRAMTKPSPPLLPPPQTTSGPPRGEPFEGDAGHLCTGAFHQDAARDAELLRPCVGAGHLLCGVELHPEICSRRTTQTATAESSEWVMEM